MGKTALFYAVQQRDNRSVVRTLIDAGNDVNITDNERKTALFYAVQQGNDSVVRALIDAGANVNTTDNEGKTALFYAVQQNSYESLVRALIDAGVDFKKVNDNGLNVILRTRTALKYALNNDSVVSTLINAGADVNRTDNEGKTALFYAAQQSNNESMVRALIVDGGDVNIIDKHGQTALFYAVQQGKNESVVRTLIDAGANVTFTDNNGQTALFYAVQQRKNENVIRELISTVSTRDIYGRTAHFYINLKASEVLSFLVQEGGNRYLKLKDNCNVDILAFLIDKWVSDSEKPSSRVEEIFNVLANQGLKRERFAQAIVNTLFLKAIFVFKRKYDKCYFDANEDKKLLHLAQLYVDKYYTGNEGLGREMKMKSIMTALKNGFPNISETLELLIEMGADPDSTDSYGNTALHYTTRLPLSNVPQKTVLDLCHKLETFGVQMNKRNHQDQSALLFCLSGDICHLKDERLLAAIKTQVEVCTFLVQCGLSIEDTSKSGESVFHLIIKIFNRCLGVRDEERRDVLLEAIKLLQLFPPRKVANGNTVNKPDAHLNSPLHLWASLALTSSQQYTNPITSENHTFKKFLEIILKYLLECGANVNARNQNDQTPLHLCKTWTAVTLLLAKKANPNVVDSSGSSPLFAAVKEKNFGINLDRIYPDVSEEPKTFWKTAVRLGLDPWTFDKDDESVLSILVESEAFVLSKSLVDVACEENYTKSESITISLLNALCKDKSIRTNWKANLVQDILRSSKCDSTPLIKPLRYCCKNVIENGARDVKKWDKTDSAVAVSPIEGESYNDDDHAPLPKRRTEESDGKSEAQAGLYQGPVTVHCKIIKLLRWYGAGGEACEEIAKEYSQLSDLLLKPLPDDQIQEFIPWTPVSKKYEDKLAKVARRQEFAMVEQIWYHTDHIGSGSFGHIFAGINEKNGREVAIKRIERLRLHRPEDKREIQNLTALADCQQVVHYVSFLEDQHFCYVVLELMEGNLEEYLNESTIDSTEATSLCKDVVMGLKFLHEQNILHRDLKPQNILYKKHPKLCLKIADFGLSRRIDSTSTTVYGTIAGTRCWVAPEILKSPPKDHCESSDMFCCGLLIHYILSAQKHPFCPADCANKGEIQVAHETEDNLMKGKMEGWDNSLSPEASHLVRKMIESTVENRPTAEEAIDHPLFWTKEKKIDLLKAVGNQKEFECPRAKRGSMGPLTAVETDLENSLGIIVKCGSWTDPGYLEMQAIYTGMTSGKGRKSYDTSSVVELVRFIRNVYEHFQEKTISTTVPIEDLLHKNFVFLEYFPALVMEVYKAVITHGWDQTRDKIKYAMNK